MSHLVPHPPGQPPALPYPGPASGADDAPPRVSSQSLLGGRAEIEILHGGQVYRLRRTALGKLILTK